MFIPLTKDCPHIDSATLIDPESLQYFTLNEKKCSECISDKNPLSLCLSCGALFCTSSHLLNHILKTSHMISVNLQDLSIWCSECKFIKTPKCSLFIQHLFENKFGITNHSLLSKEEIYDIKYKKFINLLKNNSLHNIVFMVGAGISTTAGIPDFRSKTGLFQQLQDKYNMSSPEEFFYKSTFLEHPEYFYEFCKNFDLSKTIPTLTHKFMNYMVKKGLVKYIFTQNIDGLELKAGIPKEKLVFAHGTFSEGHCPKCKIEIDVNLINKGIQDGIVYRCPTCNGPCKPNIVFYGEQLPDSFFDKGHSINDSELGIVMGTSLKVQPFSLLPRMLNEKAWKIAINRSLIGKFGYNFLSINSIFLQGTTDDVIKKIIHDCDWQEDFDAFLKSNYPDEYNTQ